MQTHYFLLTEGFALMSAASAVEPLRAANLISGQPLYDIQFVSASGGFVRSSCGAGFDTRRLDSLVAERIDTLSVVTGGNPFALVISAEAAFLRNLDRQNCLLGGISGGAVVLARAGLLGNRRFTVHWEHMEAMREEFPDLIFERRLFVLDRDRATCAGGVAPLDMMHALIRAQHGTGLAAKVSNWFIQTQVRPAHRDQHFTPSDETGLHRKVLQASKLMEDHIADPLTLDQLSQLCDISSRQLQRLFQADLGQSVGQAYLRLRLAKADELLRQSKLSLTEISIAVGFTSQSNFSRAFRRGYGQSPRAHRRHARAA
jgi:transcriptional regulator GlxA family with amidase domain